MKQIIYKGIPYIQLEGETLSNEGFIWGNKMIHPGHQFERIGEKERTSIEFGGAKLEYCGRIGHDLIFSIVKDNRNSKNDNWFISISWVNNKVLLMQTSSNGFYDIRY